MPHRTLTRLLAIAVLAALLQVAGGPPASAAPARPGGLAPSSTTVSGQPVLSWGRVKGAATYEVQMASSSDFSALLYSVATTNSKATPTANLPQSRLYWRVRGITSTGVQGGWATTSFRLARIAGPSLQGPASDAVLQQPQDPALLSWFPVSTAVSYNVQVSSDELFTSPTEYASIGTTSFLLPNPGPQQTYFWRVRANFAGGHNSNWSSVRNFDIVGVAEPELRSPADSPSTPIQDAVLDWKPVPGAVRYELRVSPDDQFNTIIDQITVTSTRYARPNTYNNDQYWWQVRSVDVHGNKSPWSLLSWQFKRHWPEAPQLIHPVDQATAVPDPFYYEWTPVEHTSHYQLQVGTDPSFSPGTFFTCVTRATTYTPKFRGDVCRPSPGTLLYWRVKPLDAPSQINGIFSPIQSFIYDNGLVQQVAPANNATVDVPTMTWHPAEDADRYEVVVKNSTGGVVASTVTRALSWTPLTRLVPAQGPFRWTVRAYDHQNAASAVPIFSASPKFEVSGLTPDDPAVDPLTPLGPQVGHESVKFPALSWEPAFVDGQPATRYELFVGPAGGQTVKSVGNAFQYPAATDTAMTADGMDRLKPGNYRWFVEAYDSSGRLIELPRHESTFRIVNPAAVQGQRLSLTGTGVQQVSTSCNRALGDPSEPTADRVCGGLRQTPVLRWDPVPEVSYYMVYVGRDRSLSNLVIDPVADQRAVTSNTMWTPLDLLPDSQAGEAYYWFVRPCKAPGICGPDPVSVVDSATHAFDKRSHPVADLREQVHDSDAFLPAHGPGGPDDPARFADEVTLMWDDLLSTNQAIEGRDLTGVAATVDAQQYRVQISADPDFAVKLIDVFVDQTTYTPYTRTLPEGPIYWRVQAIDGSGNALSWSARRGVAGERGELEKRSPTPTLRLPADGARSSSTPYLTWDPLAYAAKYQVEVYKNNDTTTSPANRVVVGESTQVAFATPVVLPPGGSPYLWRVRRLDASGLPGKWSALQSFRVKAAAPTPQAPSAGGYVSATSPLFTWKGVAGAASYQFERRLAGAVHPAEIVRTVGLSWAPTAAIPDGRYQWRVVAYSNAGSAIGGSAWRDVEVDATAPRVVKRSPLRTATRRANFVASFSEPVRGVDTRTMALFVKGEQHRLSATVKVTDRGKTATLDPAVNMRAGKTYTVKLLKGIKDRAGNPLRPISWSVTVK